MTIGNDQSPPCDLCAEFNGGKFPLRETFISNGVADRILFRGRSAVAFAGLGPLSKGYTLISPLEHRRCLADVDPGAIEEIDHLRERISEALRARCGAATSFEHGSRRKGGGGACHDHAHLHVIAGRPNLRSAAGMLGRETFIDNLAQLHAACANRSEYLLLSTDGEGFWFYDIVERVPSQFFRKQLAMEMGNKTISDWRLVHNYGIMRETIEFFS